jgi:hypothetical protein
MVVAEQGEGGHWIICNSAPVNGVRYVLES